MRFALLAGENTSEFVVIGGLNPDFLAPNAPVPHLGTTDVDLLFELGLIFDRDEQDFAWLDNALESGGFVPKSAAGWQWDAVLGDALVRLDLLCDVSDSLGQPVALPGASEATAQNLDGPAAALRDPVVRAISVPDRVRAEYPDAPAEVRLRFSSLGGYIAAKSAALLARGLDKDAYDLMFVIMFCPGGARDAARAAAAAESPPDRTTVAPAIRSAVLRFVDPQSEQTLSVVRQLVESGDESEPDQLGADISIAARVFIEELGG